MKFVKSRVAGLTFLENVEFLRNMKKFDKVELRHEKVETEHGEDWGISVNYKGEKIGFIPKTDKDIIGDLKTMKVEESGFFEPKDKPGKLLPYCRLIHFYE